MRPGVARMLIQWEPECLHEPAPISTCQRLLSALVPVRAIGPLSLWAVARVGNSPFEPLHSCRCCWSDALCSRRGAAARSAATDH